MRYIEGLDTLSGALIPYVGLGTYALCGKELHDAIGHTLSSGYRLIDTASFYGNEKEVGAAIRSSSIKREDLFIITKLYPSEYKDARYKVKEAIERLDIAYLDMMMLHHPSHDDIDAYRAFEEAIDKGYVRYGGVSCYYEKEIDRFLSQVRIRPQIVQNEMHPYYQDAKVLEHLKALGLLAQSWYPLAGRGYTKQLLEDEVIKDIAKRYHKTSAQVVLRWNIERDIIVIPGSSDKKHIEENIDIFDFKLDQDDMQAIALLERHEKHDWY